VRAKNEQWRKISLGFQCTLHLNGQSVRERGN
jgi:hypothetical protein